MHKQKFKITIVNYGIANRFPNNEIEIHKKLLEKKYAPLLNEIIEHEQNHTDRFFSVKDFDLDLKGFKNKKLYRIFVLTTLSSWVQFFPFYYTRKKLYFDFNLFLVWLFSLFAVWYISKYLLSWITILMLSN